MNWMKWIPSWRGIRKRDKIEAKSKQFYPQDMIDLYNDPQSVIDHVTFWIAHEGWTLKEKPPIDSAFFRRFSTTLPGTVWLSYGFSETKSKLSQASVLAHEFVHFIQWTQMDPNEFLKFYATPRGGWISETQALRFQMAMRKRIDSTMTERTALRMAETKAKDLWDNYPNIHLLRRSHVMEETPKIIMMGFYEVVRDHGVQRVPRRPNPLKEI